MVVKCPYCDSIAMNRQLGEEEYSRFSCYQIWEGECSDCGKDFEINIDFKLVPQEISYFASGGEMIKSEREET